MPPDARAILADPSSDPALLRRAGVELAITADDASHQALRTALADPALLDRLDPPPSVRGGGKTLGLSRIIAPLHDNGAPASRATLTFLASSAPFLAEWRRKDLLIVATDVLRPPAPEVIALWEQECVPGGVHAFKVIRACLHNASPAALDLLSRRWLSPAFPAETKQVWSRQYVVEVRTSETLIAWAVALIEGPLAQPVAIDLAWAFFDPPDTWYGPHSTPAAPSRLTMTAQARDRLRELANTSRRRLAPPPELLGSITRVEAELDALAPRPRP